MYNNFEMVNFPQIPVIRDEECLYICMLNYNSEKLLKKNLDLLKKNIKNKFKVCLFHIGEFDLDRKFINKYTQNGTIAYYYEFKNLDSYWMNSSYLIGIAFTNIFINFIKKTSIKYFGFITSDIFFIEETDIMKYIRLYSCCGRTYDNSFLIEENENRIWYLVPTFSFYNAEKFDNLDFIPNLPNDMVRTNPPYYDFGGKNYFTYFKSMQRVFLDVTTEYYKRYNMFENNHDFSLEDMDGFEKMMDNCIEYFFKCVNFYSPIFLRAREKYYKKERKFLTLL